MPFQSTVNFFAGFGVQGEYYTNSPNIALAYTINSSNAAYNIFGRACSITSQGYVSAGAPAGSVYAGILAGPKQQASTGTTSSPLDPTLTVPNQTLVSVVSMGTLIVQLASAANPGDVVIFDTATGELDAIAPGSALPAGYANALATVVIYDTSVTAPYNGLAVIQVSPNAPQLVAVPETLIGEGTFTWSGGAASVTQTVAGTLTTDIVIASIESAPTESAYLVSAEITAANTLTVTLSAANTSNDALIAYRIVRV